MSLSDDDRIVAPGWTLTDLKGKRGPRHAHAYLKAYWEGWISNPMLSLVSHGWAQLTLACLAVEAAAYFWRPIPSWKSEIWTDSKGKRKPIYKNNLELYSAAASYRMGREMFGADRPSGFEEVEFPEILFGVFRCGLAHRGMSKNCPVKNVLGVIDGHGSRGPIFRYLGVHKEKRVLSVDPQKFSKRVDEWFRRNVLSPLGKKSDPGVREAFKAWCEERWEVPASHWKF